MIISVDKMAYTFGRFNVMVMPTYRNKVNNNLNVKKMVNVIIYLKKHHNEKELVKYLLTEKLIASASIDENNILYKLENGTVYEDAYNVITSQSKSLLFTEIVKAVENKIGEETPINSIPIVSSNKMFDDAIRTKTIPI